MQWSDATDTMQRRRGGKVCDVYSQSDVQRYCALGETGISSSIDVNFETIIIVTPTTRITEAMQLALDCASMLSLHEMRSALHSDTGTEGGREPRFTAPTATIMSLQYRLAPTAAV